MATRATLAFFLLISGPVCAQNADPANVAKAQAYVDLSGMLFKSKNFADALDALRKAEPLLTGDPSLGVRALQHRAVSGGTRTPGRVRGGLRPVSLQPDEARRQARARDALARLTTTSVATLAVQCTPAAVKIRLGNGAVRVCPAEVRLAAGRAVVHASAPGFVPRDYEAAAVAGKRTELVVALSPTPMPSSCGLCLHLRLLASRLRPSSPTGATKPIATSPEPAPPSARQIHTSLRPCAVGIPAQRARGANRKRQTDELAALRLKAALDGGGWARGAGGAVRERPSGDGVRGLNGLDPWRLQAAADAPRAGAGPPCEQRCGCGVGAGVRPGAAGSRA